MVRRGCVEWIGGLALVGCSAGEPTEAGGSSATTGPVDPTSTGTPTSAAATSTSLPTGTTGSAASTGAVTTGATPDLGAATTTAAPDIRCTVPDEFVGIDECMNKAAPESFAPTLQWSFGEGRAAWVTPLVGNFTDDNGDGAIDLCDVPDVVLVSGTSVSYGQVCEVHVLDGATGSVHFVIPATEMVSCTATPAFADIDSDLLPELVVIWNNAGMYRLKAFEHDGTFKWAGLVGGEAADQFTRESGAVAIHDLDADGDAEIVFGHEVYDHLGTPLWAVVNPQPGELEASVGVDLDGDGMMEVVTGHAAYHHDGTVYWDNFPKITARALPQIANLDADPSPEVMLSSGQGLWLVEHDGTIKWGPALPTAVVPAGYLTWQRPGTIHDFNGDRVAEFASSAGALYAVYAGPNPDDVLWKVAVLDASGAAGGTAFDFLGDGVAEALYADEQSLRVYDGKTGAVLLTRARFSPTISEYPVVVDVDNDGSAEILVVSYSGAPALQVLRDADDRWVQARRIWNQHAYYVTNIHEDGTLPRPPVGPHDLLNTFRTNAQIEDGVPCIPKVPG